MTSFFKKNIFILKDVSHLSAENENVAENQ